MEFGIRQAILQAVLEEMEVDDRVCILGEGVKNKVAYDYPPLFEKFRDRLYNMPIAEAGIVGVALGAALAGLRPIVDLNFFDLILRAMDEVFNQAAQAKYVSNGQNDFTLIIKTDIPPPHCAQTGRRLESLCIYSPYVKVAIPSTPSDAKGLMKAALKSRDVTLIIEERAIRLKEKLPESDHVIPFGEAKIVRKGHDLSIITYGIGVGLALDIAGYFANKGMELEVVDLRTLAPIDRAVLSETSKKTGKVLIIDFSGGAVAASICSMIIKDSMYYLKAPPITLATKCIPIPASKAVRTRIFPTFQDGVDAVYKLLSFKV